MPVLFLNWQLLQKNQMLRAAHGHWVAVCVCVGSFCPTETFPPLLLLAAVVYYCPKHSGFFNHSSQQCCQPKRKKKNASNPTTHAMSLDPRPSMLIAGMEHTHTCPVGAILNITWLAGTFYLHFVSATTLCLQLIAALLLLLEYTFLSNPVVLLSVLGDIS